MIEKHAYFKKIITNIFLENVLFKSFTLVLKLILQKGLNVFNMLYIIYIHIGCIFQTVNLCNDP